MVESPAVTDVTLAARSVVKLVTCDSVIARLGRLVVVEVARVADEGIVVPLTEVVEDNAAGMSVAESVVPEVTRPLESVVTFV